MLIRTATGWHRVLTQAEAHFGLGDGFVARGNDVREAKPQSEQDRLYWKRVALAIATLHHKAHPYGEHKVPCFYERGEDADGLPCPFSVTLDQLADALNPLGAAIRRAA